LSFFKRYKMLTQSFQTEPFRRGNVLKPISLEPESFFHEKKNQHNEQILYGVINGESFISQTEDSILEIEILLKTRKWKEKVLEDCDVKKKKGCESLNNRR
jgi:hypothetical protein